MLPVPNYLDFLVVFDDHVSHSSLGYVSDGHELYEIAQAAGLCTPGEESPARWTGQCVSMGYITHEPPPGGDRRPMPDGPYSANDVGRVSNYRVTEPGRTEADRLRRQRRESLTDVVLGGVPANVLLLAMGEPQRNAVRAPLGQLRSALDAEQYAVAVGAAKDLVEAACKITIELAGGPAPNKASLPSLFKDAARVSALETVDSHLGRSLTAVVQRLADLRNTAGAGHGHAAQPHVTASEGRLAATAAIGIVIFLLDQEA